MPSRDPWPSSPRSPLPTSSRSPHRAAALDAAFEQRYDHYRLFTRICTLLTFDSWAEFAPDDPATVERRCRATIGDLLAE